MNGAFIPDKKTSLLNVVCLWGVVHNMISGTGFLEEPMRLSSSTFVLQLFSSECTDYSVKDTMTERKRLTFRSLAKSIVLKVNYSIINLGEERSLMTRLFVIFRSTPYRNL